MELKQLYYYMTVAELLSFSRAAERLYISQPALSQRISELEKELSVQLLVRNRRKVDLTEAGKMMLQFCRDITARIETIPEQLKQAQMMDTKIRSLRIGLTKDACGNEWFRQCMAQAIKEVKKNYPSGRIIITAISFDEISPTSLSNDFDLCIAMHHSSQNPHETLCMDALYTDHLCMLISKNNPLNVSGSTCKSILSDVDLYLIDNNEGMHYQMSRILAEMNVSPHVRYLNSENLSLLYVLSGEGAIIYPRRSILHYEGSVDLDIYDIKSSDAELYYLAFWDRPNTNPFIPIFCNSLRKICNGKRQRN